MLTVLSQTNLDTTMFIGNDEPNYKIVGLNLGLLKKGYHCDGVGATATTFAQDAQGINIEGLRTRFTKTENTYNGHYGYGHRYNNSPAKTFFKRKINNENSQIELIISNVSSRYQYEIALRVIPSAEDRKTLLDFDIVSKYSRHIKTLEGMTILPTIKTTLNIKSDDFKPKPEDEESAKLHLDSAVARTKEFEENFRLLYPLLVLRNFAGVSNTTGQEISLAEFDKFSRFGEMISDISIPAKAAKKQFIELCDIFKNNKVLPKLKANNFEFRNEREYIFVSLFGVQMIKEKNLNHFKYFDHPGINFCADYLDKTRTFDTIEAKISKEIFTRI